MFDDLHSNKFHSLEFKLSNVAHVLFIIEIVYILCEFKASMSPFKKRQHTTVTFFVGLVCKFHSVRFSLDASKMMIEMYKVTVGTGDEMSRPHWR